MRAIVFAALLCCPMSAMAQGVPRPGETCQGQLSADFAQRFADDWITVWNSRDINRIMTHYADKFEMRSPGVIATVGEKSGILKGKSKVEAYWAAALKGQPDLKFELSGVYAGIMTVAIHYRSVGRYAVVEVLEFNPACQVIRGSANRGKAA